MRILFLCQYFPPESNAPASRTFEHARYWAQAGHRVTVVCGLPNHPTGVVPPEYRGRLLHRERMDGVETLRCWLYATPNQGVFRRSLCFITFMISAIITGVVFSGKCDVVVATSPQILCGIAGYVVSLFKRRPFVLEVRDLWPQQIIDLGAVRNRAVIGLLSWLEMFMYRRARAVVTVAPATREHIAARGIAPEKIHVITNGIDEGFFTPQDRMTAMRAAQGWNDKTVVMYIGTHGMSQGLETILEAANLLREQSGIVLVFAGSGAARAALMRRARAMGLDNVVFLPMQPRGKMPECYATADICLAPLRDLEVFRYNIPSKLFEIMACARPIVLGAKGQARTVLEEAGAGIAVEPENAAAFAEAIMRLAHDPALRRQYGDNGRAQAVAAYSRRAKAADYIACLESVLRSGEH